MLKSTPLLAARVMTNTSYDSQKLVFHIDIKAMIFNRRRIVIMLVRRAMMKLMLRCERCRTLRTCSLSRWPSPTSASLALWCPSTHTPWLVPCDLFEAVHVVQTASRPIGESGTCRWGCATSTWRWTSSAPLPPSSTSSPSALIGGASDHDDEQIKTLSLLMATSATN